MATQTTNRVIVMLLGLTAFALYAHANWMAHVWRVDMQSLTAVSAIDDRPEGGKSVAVIERGKHGLQLRCNIVQAYQWPFCEIAIRLSRDDAGVDLEQFDAVRLKLRSSGVESTQPIRVFLRNYNPVYSKPESGASLKPHEVVFDPNKEAEVVEIRLSQFMVASWWVQEHPTRLANYGPELNHVTTISFATANNAKPGAHSIVVESIEFVGPWISAAKFRLGVIVFWLALILLYLLLGLRHSRYELRESILAKRELRKRNVLLRHVNDELDTQRYQDALTCLFNRRYLIEHEQRFWAQALEQQAQGRVAGLLLIDIDHFKQINDEHGHAAGDVALVEIARRLRLCVRESDIIVRWGGEEFLIFTQAPDAEALQQLAARIMQTLQQDCLHYDDKKITMSASIGYAVLPLTMHNGEQTTMEESLKLVDAALYLAKENGRNRAFGLCNIENSQRGRIQLVRELAHAWEEGEVEMTVTLG